MWILSRSIIIIAMLGIAPLLPAPPGGIAAEIGWDVFSAWDSSQYQNIATSGYSSSGQVEPKIAFFPLFPLLIRGGMLSGLSPEIVGTLINNLAFLAALILLYNWVKKSHGLTIAHWSTAILAWCPFSLFGTVIYTEGLFLFLSTAALYAFDRKHYIWTSVFGSLATATRITGLALIPTFLFVAWREKRSLSAYLAGLISSLGIASYSLYCWIKFQAPLAFIDVQLGVWQPAEQTFWGQGWLKMFAQITIGHANWNARYLVDPWYPLAFCTICSIGYWIWHNRKTYKPTQICYSFYVLLLLLWILAGDPLINTLMALGSIYLVWIVRKQLRRLAFFYAVMNFLILFSSGRTVSAERYAYGIVSLPIALGCILAQHPKWGYLTLSFFGLLLLLFSIRFSQHLWVA